MTQLEKEERALRDIYEARLRILERDHEAGLLGLSGFSARVFMLGQELQHQIELCRFSLRPGEARDE